MKHVLLFESWEVLWFKQIIANGSWIQFNIECFLNDTQWHTKTLNWMNHHCMFGVCFLKSYSRIPRFFKFSHLGSGSLAGETETSTFCANRGVADGSWQGSTCCRRGHWAVFCFFWQSTSPELQRNCNNSPLVDIGCIDIKKQFAAVGQCTSEWSSAFEPEQSNEHSRCISIQGDGTLTGFGEVPQIAEIIPRSNKC